MRESLQTLQSKSVCEENSVIRGVEFLFDFYLSFIIMFNGY